MKERAARAGGHIREALDTTWRTPERVLARARVLLGDPIPLDAATPHNNPTRAARFCSVEDASAPAQGDLFGGARPAIPGEALGCGLSTPWDWPTWINPPWGRALATWLGRMRDEARRLPERPIVALLPASRWEQDYLTDTLEAANAIGFPRGRTGKGRLCYVSAIDGEEVDGVPCASMLLGFNVHPGEFRDAFVPLGPCFLLAPMREPLALRAEAARHDATPSF